MFNNCSFNDNTFSVIAEYTHKLIDIDNNLTKEVKNTKRIAY